MHGHDLKISTKDGDFLSYLVLPEGAAKAPGIVVIQEIFGINPFIRDVCRQFAQNGFIAAAPDLFWRQKPNVQLNPDIDSDWGAAMEFYKGFNLDKGVEDIQATIDAIRSHPHCSGKVGTIGYCLGGLLTYLSAARTDTNAASAYYGGGTDGFLNEADKIKVPTLLHFAEDDHFWPKANQDKVSARFKGSKLVTIYSYPGVDHAFARAGYKAHVRDAADLANSRSYEHFRKTLR